MMNSLEEELFGDARAELVKILEDTPPVPPPTPSIGGEPITCDEAELIGIYRTMLPKHRVEWRHLGVRLVNPHGAAQTSARKRRDHLPRSQEKRG